MRENISKRGSSWVRDISPLMHADFSTRNDLYHPEHNPQGHINMGTAETHLINNEVIDLLETLQKRMKLKPQNFHYDYFYGSLPFRSAIAAYWSRLIFPDQPQRALKPEDIIVGAGCSLALEMLATMLGDPGDVFLIPAPFYSGFIDDIHDRVGVIPVEVHCGPELSKAAFQTAYEEQTKQGRRVRAVLFSSPNNPTGTVYGKQAVESLISFCMERNIDLISDEIYAQTVHDPSAHWVSTLSLVPEEYRSRVHATTSFAKDFALSGLRTGFVITFDEDLRRGMQGLSYYSAVSTHTQALLTELLQAPELPALLKKNQEQLGVAYRFMVQCLHDMNVPTIPAQGGIFIFADFSAYLPRQEFAAEYELWETLHKKLKLNISPGQLFRAPKPGWFRICYAHRPEVVEEACRRLRQLNKH